MDRSAFESRFAAATDRAVAIAARQVLEPLPAERRFRVQLNSSYDGNPLLPGEVVYPDDSDPALAVALHAVEADRAVDVLWRDGLVPEWIDLSVVDETGTETVVEVTACGRFTADDKLIYNIDPQLAPFRAVGPIMPPTDARGRFSIHHRTECWTPADLDRVPLFADRIQFLTFATDQVDADAVARLPNLPAVTLVEHHSWSSASDTLGSFGRMPKLRLLRLNITPDGDFSMVGSTVCPTLDSLTISNPPPGPWGFDELPRRAPNLTDLTLAGEVLTLDGAFGENLRRADVRARQVTGITYVPPGLDLKATVKQPVPWPPT